jgi:hypothetical protein
MTFRTQLKPSSVIGYRLTLLPRSLPNTPENVQRATNLFMAFQEFAGSGEAVKEMGMSWHVAPSESTAGGWGTTVEVVGQFVGTEEEFESVVGVLEAGLRGKGEMDFQRDHIQMSES